MPTARPYGPLTTVTVAVLGVVPGFAPFLWESVTKPRGGKISGDRHGKGSSGAARFGDFQDNNDRSFSVPSIW